jgi:hypothetical protein
MAEREPDRGEDTTRCSTPPTRSAVVRRVGLAAVAPGSSVIGFAFGGTVGAAVMFGIGSLLWGLDIFFERLQQWKQYRTLAQVDGVTPQDLKNIAMVAIQREMQCRQNRRASRPVQYGRSSASSTISESASRSRGR